jgi:hypothetical protein
MTLIAREGKSCAIAVCGKIPAKADAANARVVKKRMVSPEFHMTEAAHKTGSKVVGSRRDGSHFKAIAGAALCAHVGASDYGLQ